jgi:hypothetical protein
LIPTISIETNPHGRIEIETCPVEATGFGDSIVLQPKWRAEREYDRNGVYLRGARKDYVYYRRDVPGAPQEFLKSVTTKPLWPTAPTDCPQNGDAISSLDFGTELEPGTYLPKTVTRAGLPPARLVRNAANPLLGADFPARLRPVLAQPAAQRTKAQAEELAAVFRTATPLLKPTRDALAAARKALTDLQIPSTLVMRERTSFERPSFELRVRGSFEARGERVYAATPQALHPMRHDQPVNRLGLARWLVDENRFTVQAIALTAVMAPAPFFCRHNPRPSGFITYAWQSLV